MQKVDAIEPNSIALEEIAVQLNSKPRRIKGDARRRERQLNGQEVRG
jgi:hypothetical protein